MIHVKPLRGTPSLSRLKADYLAQEKKAINHEIIQLGKLKKEFRKTQDQDLQKIIKNKSIEIARQIDDWKKGEGFSIHIGGELNIRARKNGFGKLKSKDKRIALVEKEWNSILEENQAIYKDNRRVGVRPFVFSPDPSLLKRMTKEEQEKCLNDVTKDVVKKFRDRFLEKGDTLSYAYAVHTDTNTAHSHLYILPYSKKGHYISMNMHRYKKKNARKNGKSFLIDKSKKNRNSKLLAIEIMASNSLNKALVKHKEKDQQNKNSPQKGLGLLR